MLQKKKRRTASAHDLYFYPEESMPCVLVSPYCKYEFCEVPESPEDNSQESSGKFFLFPKNYIFIFMRLPYTAKSILTKYVPAKFKYQSLHLSNTEIIHNTDAYDTSWYFLNYSQTVKRT